MKKFYITIIGVLSIMLCMIVVQANDQELVNNEGYMIVDILEDGSYEVKENYSTFAQAQQAFQQVKDSYQNAGIVHNGYLYQAQYAVVHFDAADDCSVNVNFTNVDTGANGYSNACYGGDGAYLETSEDEKYAKVRISGTTAWVNIENITIVPYVKAPVISSYLVQDDKFYHQIKSSYSDQIYASVIYLGKAPKQLKNGEYYSFDGHYFYMKDENGFQTMILDYRAEQHDQAVNAKEPYYNYYQFLPHRSVTNYTPEDLKQYFETSLGIQNTMTNFKDYTYNGVHDVLSDSMFAKEETAFFQYEYQYGANALMMLSLSMNETAVGRSALAYSRNNLFGHAAFDSDVESNASKYLNVSSSIASHAKNYISLSYANPEKFQYHGSHFGNKAGGMNVSYASDPYWGEKAAQYYAKIDDALGNKDENTYALGIHTSSHILKVYQKADISSNVLYEVTQDDYSCILLEKIVNKDGTWYQIQKDPATKEDGSYEFQNDIAYIKADDVNIILNEDRIAQKKYHTITLNANGGQFHNEEDILELQIEEGKTPSVTEPQKEHAVFDSWKEPLKPVTEDTTYHAQYLALHAVRLSTLPKTEYLMNEWLDTAHGVLTLTYQNGEEKTLPLEASMVSGYDRKTAGVQTLTVAYGGSTTTYQVTVKESEQNTDELYAEFQETLQSLKDRSDISVQEKDAVIQLKQKLDQVTIRYTMEEKREFDRLYSLLVKPLVIVSDDGRQLGVSGIGLALPYEKQEDAFRISLSNSVDKDVKEKLKQVALGNEYEAVDYVSLSFSEEEAFKTPLVVSISKPDMQEYQSYTVLCLQNDRVFRLKTVQTDTKIIFETDLSGDFVIAARTNQQMDTIADTSEIYSEATNPPRDMSMILGAVCVLMGIVTALLFIIRFRRRAEKR